MAARQPTPNRWRGPLCSRSNPGEHEDYEKFREKMQEQVVEDGFVIQDNYPPSAKSLLQNSLKRKRTFEKFSPEKTAGWLPTPFLP